MIITCITLGLLLSQPSKLVFQFSNAELQQDAVSLPAKRGSNEKEFLIFTQNTF